MGGVRNRGGDKVVKDGRVFGTTPNFILVGLFYDL